MSHAARALTFEPIAGGSNLVTQIVDRIKEALINGQLQPGDKLPTEGELCEQFGVSRSSVREAIKTLSAIGLVRIERGNGTYIADSDVGAPLELLSLAFLLAPKSRRQLFELRRALEYACGQLIMTNADANDIDRLEAEVERFAAAVEAGADAQTLRVLDVQFHSTLFEMTHNTLFTQLGQALMNAFATTMQVALSSSVVDDAALKDHRDMIDAIRARSEEDYRKVVDRSLETWRTHFTDSKDTQLKDSQ